MTRPGKDTEQFAKLVAAYSEDPALGNTEEILDVRSRWLCGRRAATSLILAMGSFLTMNAYRLATG